MTSARALLLLLLIPNTLSLSLGELRLSIYRVLLILVAFKAVSFLLTSPKGPARFADRMIIAFSLWAVAAIAINHDPFKALESGGVFFVETAGAYYIGRSATRTMEEATRLVSFLVAYVAALMLVTLPEMLTGVNVVWLIAEALGGESRSHIGTRLGMTRAWGPFDHPIINGVICASALGLAVTLGGKRWLRRASTTVASAFTSISSGAVASIMVQCIALFWVYRTPNRVNRWSRLGLLIAAAYVFIDLLSNRSGLKVILSYLTFSPGTASWRLLIWDFGIDNALANPFFGIGFGDWARPDWMKSGSMDNFWLVTMVRYGIPAFLLLAAATFSLIRQSAKAGTSPFAEGWLIGALGLIISGCTVHYWNQAHVFFMFYLGLGAAFVDALAREPVRRIPEPA
jgi:O-antigen ligase